MPASEALTNGRVRKEKKASSVDRSSPASNTSGVNDGRLSATLYEIREILRRHGVEHMLDELARELADYWASQAERSGTALTSLSVVDPVSKLTVPPALPDDYVPFHGRSGKYGKKISVEAFFDLEEPWKRYADEFLLYAEHIRMLDVSLYHAIKRQARARGLSFGDYAKMLNILTKEQIMGKPEKGLERQFDLIRRVRSKVLARSMADGFARAAQEPEPRN